MESIGAECSTFFRRWLMFDLVLGGILFMLLWAATLLMAYSFGYQAAMRWNIEYDRKQREKS